MPRVNIKNKNKKTNIALYWAKFSFQVGHINPIQCILVQLAFKPWSRCIVLICYSAWVTRSCGSLDTCAHFILFLFCPYFSWYSFKASCMLLFQLVKLNWSPSYHSSILMLPEYKKFSCFMDYLEAINKSQCNTSKNIDCNWVVSWTGIFNYP